MLARIEPYLSAVGRRIVRNCTFVRTNHHNIGYFETSWNLDSIRTLCQYMLGNSLQLLILKVETL
jgi:hypothetical protein